MHWAPLRAPFGRADARIDSTYRASTSNGRCKFFIKVEPIELRRFRSMSEKFTEIFYS
jgi:hypothetical protein